jgi:threonine dehydratase
LTETTSADPSTDRLPVTPEAIEEAAAALAAHLPPTPLQYSRAFTAKAGCHVHLKIECVQPTRSFKVRGALNKLIRMTPAQRSGGVITASAGNHGQGVAYAAHTFQVPATVYVPDNANELKVQAIRRLGGRVVHFGRSYNEAFLEARREQAAGGATFVHAYDDPDVVAGQGTVGVELLRQLDEHVAGPDTILVPVGGGGLISGIARYVKARRPGVRVVGVEPAGADALTRSLAAGRIVTLDRVSTMADGLAASAPGALTLAIAQACVDEMIRVEEAEMLRAIRLLFEWEHLLAEPAGAAAAAALLYHHRPQPGERVVVLLSGANVADEVMLRALRAR